MILNIQPKIGIEVEFAMDIELLKTKLDARGIKYLFVENPRISANNSVEEESSVTETLSERRLRARGRSKKSSTEMLVIKPDRSVGEYDGWELNFPPTYTFEDIKRILIILQKCNPTFPEKAALHIHVDTYLLSHYNIDQIHKYYYTHQEQIIEEAKIANMYINLNEPLPESLEEVKTRKTNLNIAHAMRRHNTIEHRIYKSTLNIEDIKWCVDHTLNIIYKALETELL